MNASLNTT